MGKGRLKAADVIMKAAQLAAALEVSGTPKPGNVHRAADYPETRFEHFLAGSIALGPTVRQAALKGMKTYADSLSFSRLRLGRLIRRCIMDVKASHHGRNTHLGVCLLIIPLALAAGMVYIKHGRITPLRLRRMVKKILEATTVQDAVDASEGIREAEAAVGSLSEIEAPDVMKSDVLKYDLTLFQLMKTASSWDGIAEEWVTGMKTVFEVGYPKLSETYAATRDINTATVHVFLTILAKKPDTFLARKVGFRRTSDVSRAVRIGLPTAKKVSNEAAEILSLRGALTKEGRIRLHKLDKRLRGSKRPLNPGTSADITAASLMIGLLCGLTI